MSNYYSIIENISYILDDYLYCVKYDIKGVRFRFFRKLEDAYDNGKNYANHYGYNTISKGRVLLVTDYLYKS